MIRERRVDPADEAILAAFAARLAVVDDELDRAAGRRAIRHGAPHLHVVRGRTMRRVAARSGTRRRADGAVVVAAVVVFAAFALGRSSGEAQPARSRDSPTAIARAMDPL